MKKYITPEIEVDVIYTHDIMSLSPIQGDAADNREVSDSLDMGFWGGVN